MFKELDKTMERTSNKIQEVMRAEMRTAKQKRQLKKIESLSSRIKVAEDKISELHDKDSENF